MLTIQYARSQHFHLNFRRTNKIALACRVQTPAKPRAQARRWMGHAPKTLYRRFDPSAFQLTRS